MAFIDENMLLSDVGEKTMEHIRRTVKKAMELCKRWGGDENVVYTAALLHDCAKHMQPTQAQQALLGDFMLYPLVVHAPLGAIIAKEKYGINDERILNAIKFHTTGRKNMTKEEKIVFLADAIEDGRAYDNVENIRKQAEKSLEAGILESLMGVVEFVTKNGRLVCPYTLEAIEGLKGEIE